MNRLESGTIKDIWHLIDAKLKENPEPYKDLKATYAFQLTDFDHESYQLEFDYGVATIHHHSEKEAACTLKMKEKHFRKFLRGELNSTTAFMSGKLKVDGNIGLALKLDGLLKQYDFSG